MLRRSIFSILLVALLVVLVIVILGRLHGPGALGGSQNLLQIDHINAPRWLDGLWDGFFGIISLIAALFKPHKYALFDTRLAVVKYQIGYAVGFLLFAGIFVFSGSRGFRRIR